MLPDTINTRHGKERRAAERRDCNTQTTCRVTEPLDQTTPPAGAWNLSSGGTCVLVEAHFAPGARLTIDMHHPGRADHLLAWAEVKYAICCPSFHEMWLTGCSFADGLPDEELEPFV